MISKMAIEDPSGQIPARMVLPKGLFAWVRANFLKHMDAQTDVGRQNSRIFSNF